MYADDTALITRSRWPEAVHRRLQQACYDLEQWASDWRIGFNAAKSQGMVITRKRLPNIPNVTLFGQPIQWTTKVKYLGVIIDQRLTWKEQVTQVHKKTSQRAGALYPLLNQHSSLSIESGLHLYRTSIRPNMDYACEVWGNAAPTHIKRLQSLQNKILRRVFHVPPDFPHLYLQEAAQEKDVLERFQQTARNFYARTRSSMNPLIRQLGQPNEPDDRYKRPVALLARI